MEKVEIKASDGLFLKALYSPVLNAKASIMIIHGMIEHKERYIELIKKLNENNFNVIIADLRGHGESINDEYKLGMIGSIDLMVDDEKKILDYIKDKNPDKSIYVYSHSMGTLISREFIKKYSFEVSKLILSGTVAYKPGCGFGAWLAKNKSKGNKKNNYSKLLFALSNNLSTKEDFSWLSYNKENINNYVNDPLCGYKFTNFSNYILFSMTHDLHKHVENSVNKDLKIFSISGADDRTTSKTKGVLDSVKHLKKEGFIDVKYKEYPNMKHEILMEDNKEDVFKDIIDFYNE